MKCKLLSSIKGRVLKTPREAFFWLAPDEGSSDGKLYVYTIKTP